ncbi:MULTISPECIES: flagellar hook-length control protein FliK [Legionella]|uniref:Putative flagellar hook-length control protein n=1 Tax=Legionella drozanskii LLAP-1 TaxID=1212489 RepID=A0A0W0TC91_9GAMM|nr:MULTISPECIES: flagellar hook-length control protein FliK [Legionella]KTC93037.1 putative flagellar hook-length control protein [Legionella drozanskii LLAP-1]PJE11942.1 MAG: flagellar hook-length control protein FliK [Legionella sp.]
MMSLIQLIFSQKIPMETLSPEEQTENGEAGNSAFLTLIEHFFAPVELTPTEQTLTVNDNFQASDIEEENGEEINFVSTLTTTPELAKNESTEEEMSHSSIDTNQEELLIINSGQLAWFDADFFVPPAENLRQDFGQTDENLDANVSLTMTDNKGVSLSKEIVKKDDKFEMIDQNQIEQSTEYPFEDLPKANENLLELELPELVQDSSFENQVSQVISPSLSKEINTKAGIVKQNENIDQFENSQVQAVYNSNERSPTTEIEILRDFDTGDKELDSKLTNDPALPLQSSQKFTLAEQQGITAKTIELPQHLEHPDWSEHFNQQIVWLGQQNIKTAIIKLNPQELGPLEININVKQEDASVNITIHRSQVHEVIENAIPRLREMMAEQGLNLTQVNIESNQRRNAQSWQYEPSLEKKQANSEQFEEQPLQMKVKNGLIDYFA